MLIMKTIAGSHLYGFAHAESDLDIYEFWTDKRNAQHISDGVDRRILHIDTFIEGLQNGVPQMLEARYSRIAKWQGTPYETMLKSIKPDTTIMRQKYVGAMVNFLGQDTEKLRRHAVRLGYNYMCYLKNGFFDPACPRYMIDLIKEWAVDQDTALDACRTLTGLDIQL